MLGRLPARSIVTFDRWQTPRLRRVRGRGSPNLDIPFRDCSQKRLRPNPDRLRRLVSRRSFLNRMWRHVDQERARQRYRCLQGEGSERAVRRLISAKKPDVHQPEGSSIARPFANEQGTSSSSNAARLGRSGTFFTDRVHARDAHKESGSSAF